jgi:hypothetical protein
MRLKIAVMKLFDLCSRLDKLPYKCSKDSKFEYLFQRELRSYLFELELPLTYYNKMRDEYGLRIEWKENLLRLDEFLGGKFQDSLKEKIKQHEEKMEEIERKKKEKLRREKSKIVSRFQKREKVEVYDEERLLSLLGHFEYTHRYSPYFDCHGCGFDLEGDLLRIGKRKICPDCIKEMLRHPGLSWYHNHVRFKKEAFLIDFKKVLNDKDYIEELKNKMKPFKSRERAFDWIYEQQSDAEHYSEGEDEVWLLQLKGTSYEEREDLLKKMNQNSPIIFEIEKGNPHDKYAVGVWSEIEGKKEHIGYVPASVSMKFNQILQNKHYLEPVIHSFYVNEYKHSHPDEFGEWETFYSEVNTLCMEVRINKKIISELEKMQEEK